MLSHLLFNVYRSTTFRPQALELTSKKVSFENIKYRRLKKKSSVKERRRNMIKGIVNPRDYGEEAPPFYIPARYKLFFKYIQDNKNAHRLARKPMPKAI